MDRKKNLKKLIIISTVLLMVVVFYFSFNAFIKSNIYPAPKNPAVKTIKGAEVISVQSSGHKAKGLFIKKGEILTVLFHGNGSTIYDMTDLANILIGADCSVLIIEYPGYGILSDYKPGEKVIYEDSILLINKIKVEYNYSDENIIPVGYSIGAAVALEISKRGIGSKLILFSPFTSMDNMIALKFPKFVGTIFNTEKFDNLKKSTLIKAKTLLIHGKADSFVPIAMSEILSDNIADSELISVTSGYHNIFSAISQNQWKRIVSFALE